MLKQLLFSSILLALSACGGGSGGTITQTSSGPSTIDTAPSQPSPPTPPQSNFNGNTILGSPTESSIAMKLLTADQGGLIAIELGTQSGSYQTKTAAKAIQAGVPLEVILTGLLPDKAYFYRIGFTPSGGSYGVGPEYSFQTARPSGRTFTFTMQADSHLDENANLDQYKNTLNNILADKGDFHIDLGDTFMTEKYSQPFIATVAMAPDSATVNNRYVFERANFGTFAHSVPLFLVNGNHDGELGWLGDPSQGLPLWASQARQKYFLNPKPDAFYNGDTYFEPLIGQRASWYAWHWGDALFIALDPYWNSKVQASKDGWNVTLGERQYHWLEQTLGSSKASYKFIFIHNLVGGLDGQMRGGIEAAPYFEWGGKNLNGSDAFGIMRPGWSMPVHQLLVKNKVTAVFHGHDHLYARQELDGVTYQAVPQPSANNNSNGPLLSLVYHYNSGVIKSSSGHIRVTVSPTGVTSEYVRSWLPKDETGVQKNRQVDDRWTMPK